MIIGHECGQRWWLRRSWRRPVFRVLPSHCIVGFAVGPIIVVLKEKR